MTYPPSAPPTPTDPWPATLAAIIILSVFMLMPTILYLRIMLKFACDRSLQRELRGIVRDGKEEETAGGMRASTGVKRCGCAARKRMGEEKVEGKGENGGSRREKDESGGGSGLGGSREGKDDDWKGGFGGSRGGKDEWGGGSGLGGLGRGKDGLGGGLGGSRQGEEEWGGGLGGSRDGKDKRGGGLGGSRQGKDERGGGLGGSRREKDESGGGSGVGGLGRGKDDLGGGSGLGELGKGKDELGGGDVSANAGGFNGMSGGKDAGRGADGQNEGESGGGVGFLKDVGGEGALVDGNAKNATGGLDEKADKNDDPAMIPQANPAASTSQPLLQAECDEDEEDHSIAPVAPMLLTFKNIEYLVPDRDAKPSANVGTDEEAAPPTKAILKDVSGWFAPKTFTAILGTSGCGKSTLLSVLVDQMDGAAGETKGQVLVNGKERRSDFRKTAALVLQSDNLMESLSVIETLWFTAEMRLGNELTQKEKLDIVRETLRELDLAHVADRRISVLSGGQKRRVTVAIELVARPSLVFLDEPTSGLDASGSLKLVRVLRRLANSSRTVVCTIHQPRSDAFSLFHMVILMNAGKILYFGPVSMLIPHFSHVTIRQATSSLKSMKESMQSILKMEVNDGHDDGLEDVVNPADFVLDLTHGSPDEVEALNMAYARSELCAFTANVLENIHSGRTKPGEQFIKADQLAWFPELHVLPLKSLPSENIDDDIDAKIQKSKRNFIKRLYLNTCVVTTYASTGFKQTFSLTRRAFLNDSRNFAYLMSWFLGIIMFTFLGMLYCYVDSPIISNKEWQDLNEELQRWGACTQNFNALGQILNTSASAAGRTVASCGHDINMSLLLGFARTSLLYQLLASMFFSEMPMVASVYQDRLLYHREHASKSYSSGAWVASWVSRITFSGFVKGLIFPPFVYFSAQFPISAEPYLLFSIYMGIMSVAGASVALLVAVMFDSFETASVAFVVINVIAQNLCGYFIGFSWIPWYFRWISYCNFFRYTFEGIVLGQLLTYQNYDYGVKSGDLSFFNNVEQAAWLDALIATFFCICFHLLALFVVRYRGRRLFVASERDPCVGCQRRQRKCCGQKETELNEEAIGGVGHITDDRNVVSCCMPTNAGLTMYAQSGVNSNHVISR